AAVSSTAELTEDTSVTSSVKLTGDGTRQMTDVTVTGITEVDDVTRLETQVGVSEGSSGYRASRLSIGGRQQVDENTEVENKISFANSNSGLDETTVSFGTTKKLTDDIELTTARIFGDTGESQSTESQYGISMVRDGKELKGTLSRKYSEGINEVSRSNIFGLTGEIDDRWAVTGRYEKGDVDNLDGTTTKRDVVSLAAGYVKKDLETGLEMFKSSSKLEVRFDEGVSNRRQFLISNASEGQLTPEFSLFTKIEYSETVDTSLDTQIAQYKEFVVGGAYRPIMFDRLNVLGKYTYLENRSPASQEDNADIEEEAAHVVSADIIYDVNDKWQITEKFAMRAAKEKVEGFDFTETLTWLMIHRLTYKVNRDWAVSGEYRMLTVREAEDKKQGFVLEVTRRVGEYAQLGVGYDFTDFTDDLTNLDYTTYGPFVRVTGKLYDRSPEEIERARQKWLQEKVTRWAWVMVQDELARDESPILRELNDYFVMAQLAFENGDYEESRQIYKDIIIAGRMMHDEAAEFIRKNVRKEERLQQMKELADQYYKNGQYEKAKKILEKILEEAKKPVIK
ncbi:MAG: tetratricopeptide repeat protein, partial [Candidatus Omnitrophica bacterium]|nr:tetratricopeptide repeat protein [Candidatus Omnitrophota bacterium]